MRRGVVISPPFEYHPDGTLPVITGGLPIKDITKYLLYFDDIDIPDNGFVSVSLPPEIEYLVDQRVIKRTRIGFLMNEAGISTYPIPEGSALPGFQAQGAFSLGDFGVFPLLAQVAAYTHNNTQEGTSWSLVQLANAPYFPNATLSECLDLQLYDILPVPREDTPFDDILEFKTKEQQALDDLRGYFDEIHLIVSNSSDKEKALSVYARKISKELDNVTARMANKGIKYYLGDFCFICFTATAIFLGELDMPLRINMLGGAVLSLVASKALQASEIANQATSQAQLIYLNKAKQANIL